jgi:hypothetical protein
MRLLFLVLFLSYCTIPPVREEPLKSEFPQQEWTDWALNAFKNTALATYQPKDAKEFCPNGMTVNNWVHLLAALSFLESGYNPNSEYKENFKNGRGEYVISTGLMQLSRESAQGYKCPMNTQADLKDPKKNIECAVIIMAKWVTNDGVITSKTTPWRGAARYWSPFRFKLTKLKDRLSKWCE